MPSYRKLPSGLWQVTIYKPNGRRLTETHRLKTPLEHWAAERIAAYARGDVRDPRAGEIKLGVWRERVKSNRQLEGPTIAKAESLWRTHCDEEWATWPMSAVLRADAQDWANRLVRTHRYGNDEKPLLSPATIHETVHVMSTLYRIAMDESPPLVASNPFVKLELPPIRPNKVDFYEHDEAQRLYAALEKIHAKWRVMAELGMDVGLRPGEIFGLHTDRLDWSRDLIHVTRVLTRYGIREYAKSKKSHRTPPLPPKVRAGLAKLLDGRRNWAGVCTCPKALPGGRTKPGTGPCPGLVFSAPEGGPIDDGNFRDRVWYPAIAAAEVRKFPFSIVRHTAASWLVMDGVPLYDVQHLLGHERSTTTERYAHLKPDSHDKVQQSWARRAK